MFEYFCGRKSWAPPLAFGAVMLFVWPVMAQSDEEKRSAEKRSEVDIPDESEKWTIKLGGYGGMPKDRGFYRWKLSHDGAFEILSGRQKHGPVKKGTLSPDEVRKVYAYVAKIQKEYEPNKRHGRVEDGDTITLTLIGDSFRVSAKYDGWDVYGDKPPELREIYNIIHKKFPRQ